MRKAAAYLRRNKVIICPVSDTTDGVGVICAPVFDLEASDVSGVGAAVLEALQLSREGIPHPAPADWSKLFKPVLKAAGVGSWKTFVRSTKDVIVRFETNRIVYIPTRNLGSRNGFVPLPEKERSSAPMAAEVGPALLAAFGDAE
ncbi:hypothetical protein [Bradyrhizobium sp. AZCC 2230]|uniref:hypothetical protein n=1 Tax=Bradyrhizobium sp. AZCC 2230 TaxID=3117021 RepID=UPI002FF18B62